jgi:PAS domain S-box-containing protein
MKNSILANSAHLIFNGGGEMGALMRKFDWDNHPLGNPDEWPESLRFNIRLLLNSGFPMFLWWSEELYMFHNDAYLPALGNKHPQALGAKAQMMWSEIWDEIGPISDGILNGGETFFADSLLLVLERKGFSEETYWTFSYSPAFNDKGEISGVFCACNEVTNTVLNERRLKSLKHVSDIAIDIQTLEQAGQLTCDVLLHNKSDLPFSIIYLLDNTAATATLIGKAGDLPQTEIPELIDLTTNETFCSLSKVLTSQQITKINVAPLYQETMLFSEGQNVVKEAVVVPIMKASQQQVIGFFIAGISPNLEYNADYKGFHTLLASQIATSITSIQTREELALQQEYLKKIFQQAPVGIAIVNGPDYIIELANPGVCEIWGREPNEVLGKPVAEALPEVVDQGIIQLLDNVYNTGEPYLANELPILLGKNGELEKVYLNFIYHPLRDSKGIITGLIAVAIDISEQVKYRQSVEALNDELLSKNADLDNFVYLASHDLKAPITNIEGLVNALVEYLPKEIIESEAIKMVIELIQKSVDRFKRTVVDLTDVAKIQRESGEDTDQIDLSNIVKEVLLDIEVEIEEAGVQVFTELDPDATIHFSAKNIRSVIYNLISNALKYRSPERDAIIRIVTECKTDHVVLSVIDNGLGIKQADIAKIFSMFKRLHDHVEGSGIGLYIVKRIVENSGGSIEVESKVGEGSNFKIYFKR